jgi:hypothetical protein
VPEEGPAILLNSENVRVVDAQAWYFADQARYLFQGQAAARDRHPDLGHPSRELDELFNQAAKTESIGKARKAA